MSISNKIIRVIKDINSKLVNADSQGANDFEVENAYHRWLSSPAYQEQQFQEWCAMNRQRDIENFLNDR